MSLHFAALVESQRALGQSLAEIQRLSGASDDLVDQIVRNSQCQKSLANNGEALLSQSFPSLDMYQTQSRVRVLIPDFSLSSSV